MMVKKVTALQNVCLRKQERLGYMIVPLVMLVKRCERKSTDRCNWSGMFAHWDAKVEDIKSAIRIKSD